jgi:hypothetical protein
MMMKMLSEGGMPVLVDKDNPSTDLNPGGAYAYEPTKTLNQVDNKWLKKANKKAVKIIAWFISYLPKDYKYKVIYMERTHSEIVTSQNKMVSNRKDLAPLDENTLIRHDTESKKWLSQQSNFDVLLVDYNKLVFEPLESCQEIADFLGVKLDVDKMSKVPNSELYRNRVM